MRFSYVVVLLTAPPLWIGGAIWWFWGRPGPITEHMFAWWCDLIGVTDAAAIQMGKGIFAGATLIGALCLLWLFTALGILALDRADRAR